MKLKEQSVVLFCSSYVLLICRKNVGLNTSGLNDVFPINHLITSVFSFYYMIIWHELMLIYVCIHPNIDTISAEWNIHWKVSRKTDHVLLSSRYGHEETDVGHQYCRYSLAYERSTKDLDKNIRTFLYINNEFIMRMFIRKSVHKNRFMRKSIHSLGQDLRRLQ